ncbi:MAG: TIGR02281 family clan AA aspartic protease [Pseudomonadota bacterium]|nr:TIGR02281 family clan AA aspartic protease [Pseudomonadota bacterium]
MRLVWVILAALLAAPGAFATDVNVIGLFSGKAVIVVNRGAPRTLSIGQATAEGVKLISADSRTAVFEIDGKRQSLEMGQHFESSVSAAPGARSSVVLSPDTRGHFIVDGGINGNYVRFLVDTGATHVSMPASEAARLGIDFRKGERALVQTANGTAAVYRVALDSVTLGDITIYNVSGMVHEGAGLDITLLGMSFLNRTEMRREGATLTLTKRY